MEHELNLRPVYFDLINDGSKTIEVRLFDEKRKSYKHGDKLIFHNEKDKTQTCACEIIDLKNYDNFKQMASSLDSKCIGFEDQNFEQIINSYHTIYSEELEKKYGILAITIRRI